MNPPQGTDKPPGAPVATPPQGAAPSKSGLAGFGALTLPAYQWYVTSAMLQQMAESMQQLANGWYAYQLTGSTAVLGLVLLAQAIPQTLLSFVGGVMSDRLDRRTVWMVCVFLTGALALWLGISVRLNTIIWQDLVIRAFLFGIILAFRMPARQGLMNDIAGREHIMSAVAIQTASGNVMQFIGPATAGFVIAGLGIQWAYFIITGFYIIAALCQLFIHPKNTSLVKTGNPVSLFTSAKEGVAYIRRAPDVGVVLLFGLLSTALVLPATSLLPAFAKKVLNIGPAALGVLSSCTGVGALIGSLAITAYKPKIRGLLFIQSTFFSGVLLVAFCLSSSFVLACVLTFFAGAVQSFSNTLGAGLVQAYTERSYLGRVLSVQLMQYGAGTGTGFLVGLGAQAVGVRYAILATSVLLAASGAWFWTMSRRLRSLA